MFACWSIQDRKVPREAKQALWGGGYYQGGGGRPAAAFSPFCQKHPWSCILQSWGHSPPCWAKLTGQNPWQNLCSILFTLIFPRFREKASFSLSFWLLLIMQSHRCACCWGKFVWTLQNVEVGLACIMSFAFLFKMLREKYKCFISTSRVPQPVYTSLLSVALEDASCLFAGCRVWQRSLSIESPCRDGDQASPGKRGGIQKKSKSNRCFVWNYCARLFGTWWNASFYWARRREQEKILQRQWSPTIKTGKLKTELGVNSEDSLQELSLLP